MLLQSMFFSPAPGTRGVIFDLNLRRLVPSRRQTKQTKSSKGRSMIRGSLTRKHEGQGFRGDLQSRAVSHQRFQCAEVTLSQTPRTDCTLNNFADQSLQMQKLRNEQILKRKRKIQRFYHYAMNKCYKRKEKYKGFTTMQ